MSLSAITQTALSGVFAAETVFEVVANNLANLNTAGFKASKVEFASQTSGGANPIQIGKGVRVAAITKDLSQGPISISPTPNPGTAIESDPGTAAAALVLSGAVELSNTDVGEQLADMSMASVQFHASIHAINTASQAWDMLLQLPRIG